MVWTHWQWTLHARRVRWRRFGEVSQLILSGSAKTRQKKRRKRKKIQQNQMETKKKLKKITHSNTNNNKPWFQLNRSLFVIKSCRLFTNHYARSPYNDQYAFFHLQCCLWSKCKRNEGFTKIIAKFSTTVYVKYFQIKKLANPCNEIQKIKHHFEGHICSLISLVRKFVE